MTKLEYVLHLYYADKPGSIQTFTGPTAEEMIIKAEYELKAKHEKYKSYTIHKKEVIAFRSLR